jgi:hypothetical protein
MAKQLIVTTEKQDSVLKSLFVPMELIVQLDGPNSSVVYINVASSNAYIEIISVDPDGNTSVRTRNYDPSQNWIDGDRTPDSD